jgi:hypothetical protein
MSDGVKNLLEMSRGNFSSVEKYFFFLKDSMSFKKYLQLKKWV